MQNCIAILIASTVAGLVTSQSWDYTAVGPDVWQDYYSGCGGSLQSPINIKTACTVQRSYEPFQFSAAYGNVYKMKLIHSGMSVNGDLADAGGSSLTLTGGGLNGIFDFLAFHLHWGTNYRSGSEHQV